MCLVVGLVALKVVDYGWTAWDTYQSGRVLADPSASADDKFFAALNVSLAVGFELLEPDDIFPASLPIDDIGRRALLKSAQEVYAEGGAEAVEGVIRDTLGEHADVVLNKLWDKLCCTGQQHHILSNKIMSELGRHRILKDIFKRNQSIVQALDLGSHRGYQTWHRAYDDDVVRWLRSHETATAEEFLNYLNVLYSTPEMRRQFPKALEVLKGLQP